MLTALKRKGKEYYTSKTMWKVEGLGSSPKNDMNIYYSLDQADLHAPVPSFIKKIEVIEL